MDAKSPNQTPAPTDAWTIARRLDEILLKLLDGIERDIDDGRVSSIEAFEALCRADAARSGH